MVIQVVHCAKEARHLFLQFERRVLGNSPIPLREHVQSLPVCPGGPGLGHPSASRLHLPSLEVLNRIEWTLPNPPSVGPGRREREFPGPRSKLGGGTEVFATPSTRPRAWSPWCWLAAGADWTLCSSRFQEPILRGCLGEGVRREAGSRGAREARPSVENGHSLPDPQCFLHLFYKHFLGLSYEAGTLLRPWGVSSH